jgi:DNA-binding CsgD family transcriptional regulator
MAYIFHKCLKYLSSKSTCIDLVNVGFLGEETLRKGNPRAKPAEDILLDTHGAVGPLLPTLFESRVMGVAVIDSRIRFRAVNRALASMNGLPIASHIGKTLRHVLGASAPMIEGPTRRALETGVPVSNLEITAKLPARLEVGHWVESYLPIRDVENHVTQVAVFVVELTSRKNLEVSLAHMMANLLNVSTALKTEQQFFETTGKWSDKTGSLLPAAIELIDLCIGHTRNIADISRRYLSADAPRLGIGIDDELTNTQNPVRAGERWCQDLSRREREVLRLLAECKSNKEIARELKISVRTTETHRARIMMKLELHSIGHLIRFAVRNNIIDA